MKFGWASNCKDCESLRKRVYAQENAEVVRDRQLKNYYGLDLTTYRCMFLSQGGLCNICKCPSEESLCVDHCHSTGEIRGLLCRTCNVALGLLNDDPELLESALIHLKG